MHRAPRVIALVLLLALVVSTSAFASPPSASGTTGVPSSVSGPLARIWGWLFGAHAFQGSVTAPLAGRQAVPKAATPPVNTPPPTRPNEGAGYDPYGR